MNRDDDKWRQMAVDVTQPEEPGERAAPPPRLIGRFVVERQIGAGGFGVVLLAHDPTLDRPVALKLLWAGGDVGSEASTRLLREAQAMAKLRHPNVATVHEAGIHEGQVFLVMEYLPGGTLREKLAGPALDVWAVLALFAAAGRGLGAAHAAGLVHRDFKPDNVLLDETGVAKVTDFGLAARADAIGASLRVRPRATVNALATPLTQTGDVMGTPRYMAPEQHEARPTDARTDQFAFCVALYEALFGGAPFRGDSVATLRHSVLHDAPAAPRERDDVPARVTAAILRGLSRDPTARLPSMEALVAELGPPPRRARRALVAVAIVVPVVAAAGIVALSRGDTDPAVVAARAARACGCELLTLNLPTGAEVIGVRQVAGPLVVPAFSAPAWQPTHQLAMPEGPHVIDYRVGNEVLSYGVVSRGPLSARTLALPALEKRDGFVFVPGGEIVIGSPPTTLALAPFLIGRTEHREDLSFGAALKAAREAHARLPTAAEWEWAARLETMEGARARGWEWTATQYAPYPYLDDGRDDALAERSESEVRGGTALVLDRREGTHRGRADLRLARTTATVPPITSVELTLASEPVAGPDDRNVRTVIPFRERSRLDRMLIDWWQLDERPPLQTHNGGCAISTVLAIAGVPLSMIDRHDDGGAARPTVRWHPDRTFVDARYLDEKRIVTCDESTEILDVICFDGDRLHPAAVPIVEAVAGTLKGNPSIELIELQVYAPGADALALSQRRAEIVRNELVKRGIAPARLTARGYGRFADAKPDPDGGLFSGGSEPPTPKPGACPAPVDGERVAFSILKRR